MERAAWTNERLDDLAEAIRTGFARNDEDHREMRAEISALGNSLRGEMASLGAGLRAEMAELRGEVSGLRRMILTVGGGIIVALIGAIGAILGAGA
jgi:hypothetical protein